MQEVCRSDCQTIQCNKHMDNLFELGSDVYPVDMSSYCREYQEPVVINFYENVKDAGESHD